MITVTVPTMWKFSPFVNFLCDLVNHHLVSEVIIVDNNSTERPNHHVLQHDKVKIIDFKRNIYVNPAWNVGIFSSQYDKVCVMNDDIIFDLRVFDRVNERLTADVGCIGLNANAVINKELITGEINIVPLTVDTQSVWGLGMLFFVHKANFDQIPYGLDIYFGDNFVYDNTIWKGLKLLLIENLFHYSPYGTTGKTVPEINKFFEREKEVYKHIIISKGRDPHVWNPYMYPVN